MNKWMLIVSIACIALLSGYVWQANHRRAISEQYQRQTWLVVECSIVKDDRVNTGHSVRLTLRGPTTIHATIWEDECRIPVGTEFQRDGGFVCNPIIAGMNDVGCFGINEESLAK